MANISEIKAKTTCVDYARNSLGWNIKKAGDRTYSLEKGDNQTCLVVYDDYWYDFKTGQGGDVIDLCALARHDGNRGEAIRELGGTDSGWLNYTKGLNAKIQSWHEALRSRDVAYLHKRAISPATAKRLKLGFDGNRLVIPYWKNGYIAYYATRDLEGKGDSKYKKAKLDGMNENIPWGLHTLDRTDKPLVIAEGAFDAISFEQEGYRVLSPLGGYFNKESKKQVFDACRMAGDVFLVFDNDDAGNRFTMDMAQDFFRHRINFKCGSVPEEAGKDISDYYTKGGKLQALIEQGEQGLSVLISKLNDKEQLADFVMKSARFISKPDIVQLFSEINPTDELPRAWLKALEKQAVAPPSDSLITKEITDNYRLKFWDALGFYEFDGGIWKKRSDAEIFNYITAAFGSYASGSRISSVFKMLKGVCVSTEELNKKEIFCFKNGTLDLVTGEFRGNLESDLCSVQAEYDYSDGAQCPLWRQFVEEIADCDDEKISLLQEMCGYILFSDNRLQKCFFLLGDGANGKSVFLDTLGEVIGKGNVSNVEISGLIEPFQRIRLMSSLVNISSETQSDVQGAESVFKQLVTGDRVNGCYKGKDFIEFRSRTKFISACNEFMRSRDITSGFMRRICFIRFTQTYLNNPDPNNENQHKADRDLAQKLLAEVPGIFNWIYEGYRFLKRTDTFSQPRDEQEILDAFKQENNPLISFYQEELYAGEWQKSELYSKYRDWADKSGYKCFGKIMFMRKLKMTIEQYGDTVEEYRTGHGGASGLTIIKKVR